MGVVDVQVSALSKQITGLKFLPVGGSEEIFIDNKPITLQQGEWKTWFIKLTFVIAMELHFLQPMLKNSQELLI